jgi:hypothetical protein
VRMTKKENLGYPQKEIWNPSVRRTDSGTSDRRGSRKGPENVSPENRFSRRVRARTGKTGSQSGVE